MPGNDFCAEWGFLPPGPTLPLMLGWFIPVVFWPALFSSLLLYYRSSLTKMSNSALNVSIVFWVSFISYSLFSICVFNSFLNFLLSSSSYLHFKAFLRIFSLLCPIFYKLAEFYYNDCWLLSAEPISFKIKFLRFLISATYYKSASLFF